MARLGPRVLKASFECPDFRVVEAAVRVIVDGGLVVIPTDTVYGIAADPLNPSAVARVYRVKGRDWGKPIPILLGESHDALKFVEADSRFWRLAAKFWPGPLTIVSKPSSDAPEHLARWGSIGVRLPDCPLCRILARSVGGAITGTSANKSGAPPPRSLEEARSMLGAGVDLYIDSGSPGVGVPSTVVDLTGGEPRIVREGAIPAARILEVLGY